LKGRVKESESLNKELQARLAALEAEAKTKPSGAGSGQVLRFPARHALEPWTGSAGTEVHSAARLQYATDGRRRTGIHAAPASFTSTAQGGHRSRQPGHCTRAGCRWQGAGTGTGRRGQFHGGPLVERGVAGASAKEREAGKSFLPIGLVKAKLLGGLDAPTAGAAQSSPLPVFMRLEDLAWLPNHWRANVKDCLVTAAGYGDLSSERAYFRLEKLSCVRHDGRVLEQNISGSVYGEDGKLGLRGRLVTKQGQILANALLAGVVSGIGRGVVYQSSTVGTTALGTVVTDPDPGMEYQSGIGQGVSNAMDRLAQYYISLADKTHPIIEIDAGRLVDIGFTKGTALDVPLPEDAQTCWRCVPVHVTGRGGWWNELIALDRRSALTLVAHGPRRYRRRRQDTAHGALPGHPGRHSADRRRLPGCSRSPWAARSSTSTPPGSISCSGGSSICPATAT
jgi:hypothetical protein